MLQLDGLQFRVGSSISQLNDTDAYVDDFYDSVSEFILRLSMFSACALEIIVYTTLYRMNLFVEFCVEA